MSRGRKRKITRHKHSKLESLSLPSVCLEGYVQYGPKAFILGCSAVRLLCRYHTVPPGGRVRVRYGNRTTQLQVAGDTRVVCRIKRSLQSVIHGCNPHSRSRLTFTLQSTIQIPVTTLHTHTGHRTSEQCAVTVVFQILFSETDINGHSIADCGRDRRWLEPRLSLDCAIHANMRDTNRTRSTVRTTQCRTVQRSEYCTR